MHSSLSANTYPWIEDSYADWIAPFGKDKHKEEIKAWTFHVYSDKGGIASIAFASALWSVLALVLLLVYQFAWVFIRAYKTLSQ